MIRSGILAAVLAGSVAAVGCAAAPAAPHRSKTGVSLPAAGADHAVERAALAELTHETGDVGSYNADLVNACLRADKARG
jgi:hypothetical protein